MLLKQQLFIFKNGEESLGRFLVAGCLWKRVAGNGAEEMLPALLRQQPPRFGGNFVDEVLMDFEQNGFFRVGRRDEKSDGATRQHPSCLAQRGFVRVAIEVHAETKTRVFFEIRKRDEGREEVVLRKFQHGPVPFQRRSGRWRRVGV